MKMGGSNGARNSLETLLEKNEGVDLDQVLADAELLNECKWGNQKVIKYFNHEKLSEMLDYIIKMPPTECSHDRGHKYPFTVSELFACEISQINELFFTAAPPQAPKKAAPIEKDVNSD
jgi:hypothetical protein